MLKEIRIDTNKRGKKMAYQYSRIQHRYFPMKLADAELAISTGQAISVTFGPNPWSADVKTIREWIDPNGITNYETAYVLMIA